VIKSYYVSNFNQDYHKIFSQLNNVICNEWSILECGFYFTFELKRVLAILDWILPPKNPFHIEVICVQIKQIHCKIGDIKQYTLHTCIEVCVLVFVVLQGKNKLTTHLWVMVQIRLPISTGFHKVERLTHKVSTTPLMLRFFFFFWQICFWISSPVWPNSGFGCCVFLTLWITMIFICIFHICTYSSYWWKSLQNLNFIVDLLRLVLMT